MGWLYVLEYRQSGVLVKSNASHVRWPRLKLFLPRIKESWKLDTFDISIDRSEFELSLWGSELLAKQGPISPFLVR